MKLNVGTFDRAVRLVMGAGIAGLVIFRIVSGAAAMVLGVVAAVMIVTGLLRVCPAYRLFGFSTRVTPPQSRTT